jgi:hypothetical protein
MAVVAITAFQRGPPSEFQQLSPIHVLLFSATKDELWDWHHQVASSHVSQTFVTAWCSLISPTFNSVKVVFFVHCRLVKTTLSSLTVEAKLQFEESEFSIEWTKQDGQLMTACMLVEGVKTHKFGMDLKTNEKEWLVQEISSFLQIPCEQPTSSNQPFLNIVDAYDQRTGSSDAWNGE